MGAPSSNVEKILKIITPYSEVMRKWYENFDFYKWLPTKNNFGGRYMEVPIGYDSGGGHGHSFSDAMESETNENLYDHFKVYRTRDYGLVYINNEDIEASEGNENAFISQLEDRIEGVDTGLKTRLSYEMWSDGGGAIARLTAIVGPGAGAVLELLDHEAIFRFRIGMKLQASVDSGLAGAGVKAGAPGYMIITAIDEDAGKITVDNSANIAGLVATDFLFQKGDYGLGVKGVVAYVPSAAELTATPTLWGMTRTANSAKQAGIRFAGAAYGLTEALERMLSRAKKSSVFPDAIWVNNDYYTAISLDLGAKATREYVKFGQWGFETFKVNGGGRSVPVLADQNCPAATAFGLTRKSWVWHTLKEAPRWLTQGATTIVKPTADGVQARRGWRGQLVCRMPGDNIRGTLPTI